MKAIKVLEMLIPQGGWAITGEEYEGIQFIDCEPITKEEFEAGFAKYDAWHAQQESEKIAKRAEILQRLGLTEDEAKIILG